MGGQTTYTPELAERICERLAEVGSLRKVCEAEDMPADRTVRRWLQEHPEFESAYARAKEYGIDALVEEGMSIVDQPPPSTQNGGTDTGHVAWAKARAEYRRWLAERMAPKKYGLKQDITSGGKPLEGAAVAPVFHVTMADPKK
jgi:hypothetical protein